MDWKSYGFEEVLTASGGSIARDLIEQKKPELLVTDIRMPRVSGLDLVKYIDEKNYPTKTIILSGYSEFEYASAGAPLWSDRIPRKAYPEKGFPDITGTCDGKIFSKKKKVFQTTVFRP